MLPVIGLLLEGGQGVTQYGHVVKISEGDYLFKTLYTQTIPQVYQIAR